LVQTTRLAFKGSRYLTNVPASARVVVLAKAWLGDEAVRALDA
jgi:hypothetical protein